MQETKPLAYVLGWIPFIHTEIYLDSKPLIPRTETEYWVDLAIKEIKNSGVKEPKVLDLCAGSGCIGIAILTEIPKARVDFVEIEESHHKTIEKNIKENDIHPSRARIFGGNLFEQVSGPYDFILSNPPYINPNLKDRVQESVLKYEPWKALDGGKNGLEIINNILTQAKEHLSRGGILYLEHEPEQVEILSKYPGYLSSEKDQFGVSRFSKFKVYVD